MLERYVTSVLLSKFGSLVDGLDPNHASVSLWEGRVSYRNLTLRSDAATRFLHRRCQGQTDNKKKPTNATMEEDEAEQEEHDAGESSIPNVEVRYGRVGSFEVRVPWSILRGGDQSKKKKKKKKKKTWRQRASALAQHQDESKSGDGGDNDDATARSVTSVAGGCSVVLRDVYIVLGPLSSASAAAALADEADISSSRAGEEDAMRRARERQIERLVKKLVRRQMMRGTGAARAAPLEEVWTDVHLDDLDDEQDSNDEEEDEEKGNEKQEDEDGDETVSTIASASGTGLGGGIFRLSTWKDQYVRSVLGNLFSTLSVTVQNVHIRYRYDPHQDACHLGQFFPPRSIYERPYALGVTLRALTVQTTDGRGGNLRAASGTVSASASTSSKAPDVRATVSATTNATYPATAENIIHKLVAVYQLASYWDTGQGAVQPKNSHIHFPSQQGLHHPYPASENPQYSSYDQPPDDDTASVDTATTATTSLTASTMMTMGTAATTMLPLQPSYSLRAGYGMGAAHRHHYVLQPMSPSFHLSFQDPMASSDEEPANDGGDRLSLSGAAESPMKNRAVLSFPSFHMSLSRDTLEDLAHLRQNLLLHPPSDEDQRRHLCRVTARLVDRKASEGDEQKLVTDPGVVPRRPRASVSENPLLWWKYAVWSVCARHRQQHRVQRLSKKLEGKELQDVQRPLPSDQCSSKNSADLSCQRWYDLVDLVSIRRKYIEAIGLNTEHEKCDRSEKSNMVGNSVPEMISSEGNKEGAILSVTRRQQLDFLENSMTVREISFLRFNVMLAFQLKDINHQGMSNITQELRNKVNTRAESSDSGRLTEAMGDSWDLFGRRFKLWSGRAAGATADKGLEENLPLESSTSHTGQGVIEGSQKLRDRTNGQNVKFEQIFNTVLAPSRSEEGDDGSDGEGSSEKCIKSTSSSFKSEKRRQKTSGGVGWDISAHFISLAVQCNDRQDLLETGESRQINFSASTMRPIVRFQCSTSYQLSILASGEWEARVALSKLEVLDLLAIRSGQSSEDAEASETFTASTTLPTHGRSEPCDSVFPNSASCPPSQQYVQDSEDAPRLLGRKKERFEGSATDVHERHTEARRQFFRRKKDFDISGDCDALIKVRKWTPLSYRGPPNDIAAESKISVSVQLLPLEAVYSFEVAEALRGVFSAVSRTTELRSDCRRVSSAVRRFGTQQREKITQALLDPVPGNLHDNGVSFKSVNDVDAATLSTMIDVHQAENTDTAESSASDAVAQRPSRWKVIFDIDVAAPILCVPEFVPSVSSLRSQDSENIQNAHNGQRMMIVIDLGRIRLRNEELGKIGQREMDHSDFTRTNESPLSSTPTRDDFHGDDVSSVMSDESSFSLSCFEAHKWNMEISNIQVLSCNSPSHKSSFSMSRAADVREDSLSLVEPFSLQFAVTYEVDQESWPYGRLTIRGSLPRLGLNMTTRTLRLLCRMRHQKQETKRRKTDKNHSVLMQDESTGAFCEPRSSGMIRNLSKAVEDHEDTHGPLKRESTVYFDCRGASEEDIEEKVQETGGRVDEVKATAAASNSPISCSHRVDPSVKTTSEGLDEVEDKGSDRFVLGNGCSRTSLASYPAATRVRFTESESGAEATCVDGGTVSPPVAVVESKGSMAIEVEFRAPLIALHLENDVDEHIGGAYSSFSRNVTGGTPLVHISFHGASSQVVRDASKETTFRLRVGDLYVTDLLAANDDFAWCIFSSRCPDAMDRGERSNLHKSWCNSRSQSGQVDPKNRIIGLRWEAFDCPDTEDCFVQVDHKICYRSDTKRNDSVVGRNEMARVDSFNVQVRDSFVEWNPETIAAVQKAIHLPQMNVSEDASRIRDAAAVEESDVLGSIAKSVGIGNDSMDLDDPDGASLSSSEHSCNFFDALEHSLEAGTSHANFCTVKDGVESSWSEREVDAAAVQLEFETKMFLSMSKLRFRLNKAQNSYLPARRLGTVKVDSVSLNYCSKAEGGYKVSASLSNFILWDDSITERGGNYGRRSTLYGQLLGAESSNQHTVGDKIDSLLTVSLEQFPRRAIQDCFNQNGLVVKNGQLHSPVVSVTSRDDCLEPRCYNVDGCDLALRVKFSPMRFVYLQQVWLEIVDYVFEGIMGAEVRGAARTPPSYSEVTLLDEEKDKIGMQSLIPPILDPLQNISFFHFAVEMERPVIVLPVTYRSPMHMKVTFDHLTVKNSFFGRQQVVGCGQLDMEEETTRNEANSPNACRETRAKTWLQWFNSADVIGKGIILSGAHGKVLEIDRSCDSEAKELELKMKVNWPSGPAAPYPKHRSVVPRWNISSNLSPGAQINLQREDYALFLHFLAHNIGEQQRNLDLWEQWIQETKSLEVHQVKKENEGLLVKFNFEKKDNRPTTYAVQIRLEEVIVNLEKEFKEGSTKENTNTDTTSFSSEAACRIDKKYSHKPHAISHVATLRGEGVLWTMQKLVDLISNHELRVDSCCVSPGRVIPRGTQGLAFSDVEARDSVDILSSRPTCEGAALVFRSSSDPSTGSNTKTVSISGSDLVFHYPSWVSIKRFFSNIPAKPLIFSDRRVNCSMQVGDKWYSIGRSSSSLLDVKDEVEDDEVEGAPVDPFNERQLRIIFDSVFIILVTDNYRKGEANEVGKRAFKIGADMDYLYTNRCSSVSHDVLLSSICILAAGESENTILQPASLAVRISSNSSSFAFKLFVKSLKIKTSYSDLVRALNVWLTVERDVTSYRRQEDTPGANPATPHQKQSKTSCFAFRLDSFHLLFVDDSNQHFAGAQDLLEFFLGGIEYERKKVVPDEECHVHHNETVTCVSGFHLNHFHVLDCLHRSGSPFRLMAKSSTKVPDPEDVMRESEMCSPLESRNKEYGRATELPSSKYGVEKRSPYATFDRYAVSACMEEIIPMTTVMNTDIFFADLPLKEAPSNSGSNLESVRQKNQSWSPFPKMTETQPDILEVEHVKRANEASEIDVKFRCLTIQCNPATVTAIQGVWGGFNKEIKTKLMTENHSKRNVASKDSEVSSVLKTKPKLEVSMLVVGFTVCLNKEILNRRLLSASVLETTLIYRKNAAGESDISCTVQDLWAFDPSEMFPNVGNNSGYCCTGNRMVLHVTEQDDYSTEKIADFVSSPPREILGPAAFNLHFITFNEGGSQSPILADSWVIDVAGSVERLLSINLGPLRFTYLHERTTELIDYLANLLPDRNISNTADRAEVPLRNQTDKSSAVSIIVEAPTIVFPRHATTELGLVLTLGDIVVRRWYEGRSEKEAMAMQAGLPHKDNFSWNELARSPGDSRALPEKKVAVESCCETRDWWNCVSFSMLGIGRHTDAMRDTVDLHMVLRKPLLHSNTTAVRAKLSHVEAVLTYRNWSMLRAILRDNINRPVDKKKWDIGSGVDHQDKHCSNLESGHCANAFGQETIRYSSNARFIRYGISRKSQHHERASSDFSKGDLGRPLLDLSFEMKGFYLTLHRNDEILKESTLTKERNSASIGGNACLSYDLARLQVEKVLTEVKFMSSGNQAANISLYSLNLCDLGDLGRNFREISSGRTHKGSRHSCAFSVLAEGYCHEAMKTGEACDEPESPQLFVTVTKSPTSHPHARIAMNYMSLNALVRPILEICEFLSCAWRSVEVDISSPLRAPCDFRTMPPQYGCKKSILKEKEESAIKTNGSMGFRFELVANYPRLFFVADESDPFSRALVLRGLAVINYSVSKRDIDAEDSFLRGDCCHGGWKDVQTIKTIDAELHSMESYINPNVDGALGPNRYTVNSSSSKDMCKENEAGRSDRRDLDQLGVALLEPVTATFTLCQKSRELFPTLRSLSLHMDAVSTMVSFGDIGLIESLSRRWTAERIRAASEQQEREMCKKDRQHDTLKPDGLVSPKEMFLEKPFCPSKESPDVSATEADLAETGQTSTSISDTVYDVVFSTSKLGLILRKTGNKIIVDDVQMQEYKTLIGVGDSLVAIAGESLARAPLQSVVKRLECMPRPLHVTFKRKLAAKEFKNLDFSVDSGESTNSCQRDSLTRVTTTPSQDFLASCEQGTSNPFDDRSDEPDIYTIEFSSGLQNGLRLEKSQSGDVSVVAGVDRGLFAASTAFISSKGSTERETRSEDTHVGAIDSLDLLVLQKSSSSFNDKSVNCQEIEAIRGLDHGVRLPRPGSVVLAVNFVSVTGIGHEETVNLLNNLRKYARTSLNDSNVEVSPDVEQSKNSQFDVDEVVDTFPPSDTYQITFLEATASDWANLDCVDVKVSGCTLTVIDDINGRDMPLLRGNLKSIEFRLDRGMGLATEFINASVPSFLCSEVSSQERQKVDLSQAYDGNSVMADGVASIKSTGKNSGIYQRGDSSELILNLRAGAKSSLDYYNARVALWEPLLEPCYLHMHLEHQKCNAKIHRPGHLAVVISDGSKLKHAGVCTIPHVDECSSSEFVCMNFTDAAAEMLFRAANEWQDWRLSFAPSSGQGASPLIQSDETTKFETASHIDQNGVLVASNAEKKSLQPEKRDRTAQSLSESKPMTRTPPRSLKGRGVVPKGKAADDAVKVALAFAQKREASTRGKGNIAKPFVLRNRTGVSIAFAPQTSGADNKYSSYRTSESDSATSVYRGLEQCDPSCVRTVSDGNECRFNMDELMAETFSTDDNRSLANTRVRTYNSHFPFLRVALDPSLGLTEPLRDLSVVKMGQTLRRLHVETEGRLARSRTYRTIQVVWTVELENNRRVLTLSGGISIASIGCGVPMEIGAKCVLQKGKSLSRQRKGHDSFFSAAHTEESGCEKSERIVSIGVALAGVPFFLPLWLGVEERIAIHVRPASNVCNDLCSKKENLYNWSSQSILNYVPEHMESIAIGEYVTNSDFGKTRRACSDGSVTSNSHFQPAEEGIELLKGETVWKWKQEVANSGGDVANVVSCFPKGNMNGSEYLLPLSLVCLVESSNLNREHETHGISPTKRGSCEGVSSDDGQISVSISSCLSFRNLLPVDVEWEVVNGEPFGWSDGGFEILDGSSVRLRQFQRYGQIPVAARSASTPADKISVIDVGVGVLRSGWGVEVYQCNLSTMNIHARFRCAGCDGNWSEWAKLTHCHGSIQHARKVPTSLNVVQDDNAKEKDCLSNRVAAQVGVTDDGYSTRVQCLDGIRTPVGIGLRVQKKGHAVKLFGQNQDGTGMDVFLFSELWIKNHSDLPLVFGAPATQIFPSKHVLDGGDGSDSAGKMAAEAALMEIASVLEGREIYSDDEDTAVRGEILILPQQQAFEVWEEVFEYIEVESSCVKRRWWASERHDLCRIRPTLMGLPDRNEWMWDGKNVKGGWKIDCSGQVNVKDGGWESCRNLVASRDSTFSSKRLFDPSHPFRRRRWFRKRVRVNQFNCADKIGLGSDRFHKRPVASRQDDRAGAESSGIDELHSVMFYQPVLKMDDSHLIGRDGVLGNVTEKDGTNSTEGKLSRSLLDVATSGSTEERTITLCIKCGDGRWSSAVIPPSGTSNGVLRVSASRWPHVRGLREMQTEPHCGNPTFQEASLSSGSLSPAVYELSYDVSLLDGVWGEYSRILTVSPRFMIRNDSERFLMDIKQVGAEDDTIIRVGIGEVVPFYWSDCRLPELVCVRPVSPLGVMGGLEGPTRRKSSGEEAFKWSGGIDMCRLGMTAVRTRRNMRVRNSSSLEDGGESVSTVSSTEYFGHIRDGEDVRTIRAHVEIRPGTGGTGITFSLKEEDPQGEGSLFRIENRSPFPLWIVQNGLLANPTTSHPSSGSATPALEIERKEFQNDILEDSHMHEFGKQGDFRAEINGDLIRPYESIAYGLDAPYRQGKHHREVSNTELHLVRIALAPFSSRDGVESTKVFGLTTVGNVVRLGPSKLRNLLDEDMITELLGVRVFGVVCADGPTRVARFCLMQKAISAGGALGDVVRRHAKQGETYLDKISENGAVFEGTAVQPSPTWNTQYNREIGRASINAAHKVVELLRNRRLPTEGEAQCRAYYGIHEFEKRVTAVKSESVKDEEFGNAKFYEAPDYFFIFRASFKGFLCSFVDSEPTEIAVASMRSLDVFANWNAQRTNDATVAVTIGWLQVDNHCPSSPFPVTVCPDEQNEDVHEIKLKSRSQEEKSPLLAVRLAFTPKHSSGISCLRSVVVAPKDLAVFVDVAFLIRFQRLLVGVQDYLHPRSKANVPVDGHYVPAYSELSAEWPLPDLSRMFRKQRGAAAAGVGSREIYFEGLTILPCNVNLSVAPSRALSKAQASLEGVEATAIHAAVKKGDLLVSGSDGGGVFGGKVGGKNLTASAVLRGVFRNILFDALLRCDSAGLNFPGVALRNHISNGPQLKTYLLAHYLTALRNNVPALLGSLAAFGNPMGLIRGLGDGVSDFVSEPIKGLRKSVKELDPTFVVDGVARGTGSLARHTVSGFADSASLLTETLSKNMAVLTLDRKYAQRRDRGLVERDREAGFVEGVGVGGIKLFKGVIDGVTGVVRAPILGAERSGVEGFAKGVGKGLLGLVVKPVIGLSDAATEVMIGVKGSVEKGGVGLQTRGVHRIPQMRPRRAFYGDERALRVFKLADARASSTMMKTKLAGEKYLSHCDLKSRLVLFSTTRFVLMAKDGKVKQIVFKYKAIKSVHAVPVRTPTGDTKWGVSMFFYFASDEDNDENEIITCQSKSKALELCSQIQRGKELNEAEAL